MENDLELALIQYNKKTWCKSALLGFFVGLAVIVPGISGSTVAIIFKLYDQFLYAIGNLFKRFKKCFTFLLPIGLGILVGLLFGFITVKKLLEWLPFAVVGLFAGLMSGAFPAVKDEIKGAERTTKRVVLFFVGVLIPILIGVASVVLSAKGGSEGLFDRVEWWQVVLALPIGYAVGVTQIVPGLSASAILMSVGWFTALMGSVSMTFWRATPAIFAVYAGLGIGFLLGLFTFSKLLTTVFNKARHTAYSMIVGLSLGSIVTMFYNPEIFAVYRDWAKNGVDGLELVLGIVLFALGAVGSYLLVRYQRKKDQEAKGD
ncbi:MAG: DUF368 domain-containing protein [Clostridia bacterium]|nr:DUF368 domain-containing protein [Clostridia bacterium]